jgi:hypothetical protein
VRRWLRWAGVVGRERVPIVRLEQRGEFRMGRTSAGCPSPPCSTTPPIPRDLSGRCRWR